LSLTLEEFRRGVRVAEEGYAASEGDAAPKLYLEEASRVEVRVTGAYLPSGVEIEDTPGLNEQAGRSAGALAAMGRADLVLFVLAADQLLGDVEREIIDNALAKDFHRNILFLVNFWDTIDDDQQRAVLRNRVEAILNDFPSPFRRRLDDSGLAAPDSSLSDVYYISALQAVRAQRQRQGAPEASVVPRLRARLRHVLGPESSALLLRSRVGRALRYERLLRQAVSKAAAELVKAPTTSPSSQSRAGSGDEAAAAATRAVDGLPGAIAGATARLDNALEHGASPRMQQLELQLSRASATEQRDVADIELRRNVAAELRALAAEHTHAAQDAVDLIVAQARAAYLARGLTPPALDVHLEPLGFTVPHHIGASALHDLLRSVPRLLRDDLEAKAPMLSSKLKAVIHNHGRHDSPPEVAREQITTKTGAGSQERVKELHALEGDLLRLDAMLVRLLDGNVSAG
jgi:hypothetical protein